MMQANDNNAIAMRAQAGSFVSRRRSAADQFRRINAAVAVDDVFQTPKPPTSKPSLSSMLPPPVATKRRVFAVDLNKTFPCFPSLETEATLHDDTSTPSSVSNAISLDDYNNDDMEMMFSTPSQPDRSPLSVDMFEVPRLKLMPRGEASQEHHVVPTERRPQDKPLPMLPSLLPEDDEDMGGVGHRPFQLSYRPRYSQFSPAARTA